MTADQDMPNTVDPAKAELWKAMGCPRWDLLPVEDNSTKPQRAPLWLWLIAVPLVGVGVIAVLRI